MALQKELEIKLEVEPANLRRLDKFPLIKKLKQRPKYATEASVYFDTEERKFRKKALTLRVRRSEAAQTRHVFRTLLRTLGNQLAISSEPKVPIAINRYMAMALFT